MASCPATRANIWPVSSGFVVNASILAVDINSRVLVSGVKASALIIGAEYRR